MERTQEMIHEELRNGSFVSYPGDVFIVKHSSGMISNSLSIEAHNDHPVHGYKTFWFGLPNELNAWKFLKQINEMGGRKVLYQIDENEPFPFEQSVAYRYRFDPTYRRR